MLVDALLEPFVAAVEDAAGGAVLRPVVVRPHRAEAGGDPPPGHLREDVGQLERAVGGALRSALSKIGLKAIKPMAQATHRITIDSRILRRSSRRTSADAHSTTTGATSKAPARSPSHQVSHTDPAVALST